MRLTFSRNVAWEFGHNPVDSNGMVRSCSDSINGGWSELVVVLSPSSRSSPPTVQYTNRTQRTKGSSSCRTACIGPTWSVAELLFVDSPSATSSHSTDRGAREKVQYPCIAACESGTNQHQSCPIGLSLHSLRRVSFPGLLGCQRSPFRTIFSFLLFRNI